jgi:2-polyprenyl-3-methyl-5-hydroxy-6-metoxy-1,4-benzoquinol methylase
VSGATTDLYDARFNDEEVSAREAVWREVVRYLERWIDPAAPIIDIGCDRGLALRWVHGSERWGVDVRNVAAALPPDVRFVQASGLDIADRVPVHHFGTVLMSNYLEHLESGDAVIAQLQVAAQLLRPGGNVIVLQPNIRLVGPAYWDFIDHRVALTENSLLEAADLAHLRTVRLVRRFLPYSTKSHLPTNPMLVRAYLSLTPAWRLLGRQTLYIGTPT